jgi:hypothetical protein
MGYFMRKGSLHVNRKIVDLVAEEDPVFLKLVEEV